MKATFLIMVIFVAISNPGFCINLASENRGLNPSNCSVQKQQLSERFIISLMGAISKNVDNYQLTYDSRKTSRGKGASGGGNINNRPAHMRSLAESLLSGKLHRISSITLYASLALIFFFPF